MINESAGRAVTRLMTRLERAKALDRPAQRLRSLVMRLPQPARDVLNGVPIGHPVHPPLVVVPLGAWMSASVLDCVPRTGPASAALIAVGMAGAVPAAAAGWADWSKTRPPQQRVGLVHAACNSAALGLYGLSLLARMRRHRVRGRLLALGGLVMVSAGGELGGHLAYRLSTGVNHASDVAHQVGSEWHPLAPMSELPDGVPLRRDVAGTPVMVLRYGQDVHVLAEKCSHLGGPLAEGTLDDGCVRCPWHGSTFRIDDGAVVHGPATAPQPVFSVRINDGMVEVRPPETE